MMLLITHQPGRLGKGDHRDGDATPDKLGVLLAQLNEMRLAGQSSQVTEKN